MEIRVLRYFLATAKEGSMTKAAELLHVTQPTLSRQLKALEEELGVKLFIRKSHHSLLTEEGVLLQKRAEEIMDLVAKTEKEFNSEEIITGDIYIGSGETRAMTLIAEIVKELQHKYPLIKYHFYTGNSDGVTEKLDSGIIDFGILIQPADLSKYNYINLPTKDVWGVVMRKDSPLASKKSIQKKDLIDVPLLLSEQAIKADLSRNEFSEWFGADFDKLNVITTFNLIYNATILVEEGIGYAITIDKITDTSQDSNLCFRPLEPRLESDLNIVWKKQQIFSKAANLFFNEIQSKF